MNKKLIITIFVLVLALIIINIYYLKAFCYNLYWKYEYNNKSYENSVKYFEKAWNRQWIYNKANSLYKQWKYTESIKEYMSIKSEETSTFEFKLKHNIANNFYRLGQAETDSNKKIQNWEKTVDYYKDALTIMYDEETKQNLEFVLKKIAEEKEKQKNEEKEQNQENQDNDSENKDSNWNNETWTWSQEQTGSWSQSEQKTGSWSQEQSGTWSETEKDNNSESSAQSGIKEDWKLSNQSWSLVENDWKEQQNANQNSNNSNENKTLSKEQEQALQQYQESLKQMQKNNADNFNKVYNGNNSNDPFDNFFNDPFFNNDLLNWDDKEKDW